MAFDLGKIVRDIAIPKADTASKGVQVTVTHRRWTGKNAFGKATYDDTTLPMIVERKERMIQAQGGNEVLTKHLLTRVGPIAAQGAANRSEPVDLRDVFVLPDGTTGPTVAVDGIFDPLKGAPFMYQIWLGASGGTGSL